MPVPLTVVILNPRSLGTMIFTQQFFYIGIGNYEIDKVHIENSSIVNMDGEIWKPCHVIVAGSNEVESSYKFEDVRRILLGV